MFGCDNSETAEGVRHGYVERHREAFLYEGTTHEYVLSALRSVMADQGYTVTAGRPGELTTNTHPLSSNGDTDGYVIHFIDLRWRNGFTVEIVNQAKHADGTVYFSNRVESLEWELIQRADPDRAVEIMAKANEKADKVPPRVHPAPTAK